MNLEKKIKMALTYTDISQAELARRLGMTPANFNIRMKRGTFKVEELEVIAQALGAKFTYTFDFEDGTKI